MRFQPPPAAACLYTTVRNISGKVLFFGFLPPHGKKLDIGEEITIPGTIHSYFARPTYHGRHQRSFESAVAGDNPTLAIVKTPAVHVFDEVLDRTYILKLHNGSFIKADPCWGTYSSSVTDQFDA
jgi:hypothetical protein